MCQWRGCPGVTFARGAVTIENSDCQMFVQHGSLELYKLSLTEEHDYTHVWLHDWGMCFVPMCMMNPTCQLNANSQLLKQWYIVNWKAHQKIGYHFEESALNLRKEEKIIHCNKWWHLFCVGVARNVQRSQTKSMSQNLFEICYAS